MLECNVSISAYGEMGRWSRAKIGICKQKNCVYLMVNMATKSHKFPLDKLRKIHAAALEFYDPNRTVNIKTRDAFQLKLLMKQCSAFAVGKLDKGNLPLCEFQQSAKPAATSVTVEDGKYDKKTFKNQSLNNVTIIGTYRLPKAIWNLNNLTALTMTDCDLIELPPSIFKVASNLKTLNLSQNKIKRIEPVILGRLRNLVALDLSHNQLKFLPLSIGQLRSLSVLKLTNNQIHNLPFTFACMSRLKELNLSNNCIVRLNQFFMQKLMVKRQMKLNYIDLSDNVYPKYVPKERASQIPDLFTLAASQVLNFTAKINQLYLHLPTDMEDYINIRAEICCSCSRPFLRFKPGTPGPRFYLGQISSSVRGSVGDYNYIQLYSVKCFYCEQKLIDSQTPI